MSKKVIYFNDDEILKGGDIDSVISKTNHNTLLTSNSNIHVGGNKGNNNCGNPPDNGSGGGVGASPRDDRGGTGDKGEGVVVNKEVDVDVDEEGEGVDDGGGGGVGVVSENVGKVVKVIKGKEDVGEGGGGGGSGVGEGVGEGEGGGGSGVGEGGGGSGSGSRGEGGEDEEGEGGGDNPSILRGGANESTQLNQLVEQLLATNMAKISNQLTSQSGGGLNITDVLSGINEQLSNLNTNIGKIIQLNNKNI
jgi:hypothetical protein